MNSTSSYRGGGKEQWRIVTKADPCAICGKDHACKMSEDGAVAMCLRVSQGAFKSSKDGQWHFHRLKDSSHTNGYVGAAHRPKVSEHSSEPQGRNWQIEIERLRAAMTEERMAVLAEATGVPASAWAMVSPGWASRGDLRSLRAGGAGWADDLPEGAWVFAEYGGDGRVVGLSLRAVDGRKGAPAGSKRGLIVPSNLHQLPDPVLIVEGASDVAACCALGLAAVGRPSNRAGAEDLAIMLDGRQVLVVGERDGKPGGAWPGRDGAKAVAQQLARRWGEEVGWTLPPVDVKDVREWLRDRVAGGLDPADASAMQAAGAELLAMLSDSAKTAKAERRTQADALVDLAREHYRLGLSTDGEAFAVALEGPAVAMMSRGGGSGLRSALAKRYRQVTGKTPSASALADALVALEGMAQDAEPEPVALRLAEYEGGVVVDLGDPDGRAVVVTEKGWTVVERSPVLFRRTALTAPLPEPVEAEAEVLAELRGLLNVDDDSWPLVVGYLVSALIPKIPHPVLMLGGEQGTGKTTAARLMIGLVDPSTAPLRSEPRDPEQWAIAAAGSWCVCIDNISHISGWLSDAICKAVTGDGLVRRKLYTDSDLAVLAFRRCIMLTSIDAGALRGDLGDRLLLVDLERIPDDQRRTEADLEAAYMAMRPRLLGALLSVVSGTLAALPSVELKTMPRMADFARVLAALDTACPELTGGRALELFSGQRRRIAGEVVESDAVAAAVVQLMDGRNEWSGTASELLEVLTPKGEDGRSRPPKGWPTNGRALSGRLKRLRPALLAVGINHVAPAESDKTRTHRIEKAGNRPPEPPTPPRIGIPDAPGAILDGRFMGGTVGSTAQPSGDRPTYRPVENGDSEASEAVLGGSGGMGGPIPHISGNGTEAISPNGDGRQRGRIE